MTGSIYSSATDLEFTDTRPIRIWNVIIYNNSGGSNDVTVQVDPNATNLQYDCITCADGGTTRRNYKGGLLVTNGVLFNNITSDITIVVNYEFI